MSHRRFQKDYARQVRLFRQSRDRWKQRCAAKQDEIRYLRVRLRDLEASRQHWKQEARQARGHHASALATSPHGEPDLGEAQARRPS